MLQKILILAAFSLFVGFRAWKRGRVPVLWCLFTFAAGMFRTFYAAFPLILLLMLPRLERKGPSALEEYPGRGEDRTDREGGASGSRGEPPRAAPAGPPPPLIAVETFTVLGDGSWHLASGGIRSGPYAEDDVIEMLRRGKIRADTYVWSRGMADWMPARAVGNFRAYC